MIALLAAVSLPYLRAHALRIFLTLLGVVIGVQGMVAMGALNRSILQSFEAGVDAIAGNATLQVAGPETGIPESLTSEVQAVPGVESAIAMIEGTFRTVDGSSEPIAIFGVDLIEAVGIRNPQFPREHVHIADELRFLNALDSIALGQPLLDRLHLTIGENLRLATPDGAQTFTVRGSLDAVGPAKLYSGAIGLLDLPNAQRVFLAPGLVRTIYVVVRPGASIDTVAERLKTTIGTRARVERTTVRGEQVDAILGSLRVALSLASLVTMIVGFFIIYQTIAISVEQRRRDIAITRSLGFTRSAVSTVFVSECLLLGVLGSAGGILSGYVLARLSLRTAIAGISDMYVQLSPGEIVLPPLETTLGAALGIATCLGAGFAPALRAAREPPAQVLRSTAGVQEERLRPIPTASGVLAITLAICLLTLDLRLVSSTGKTAWIMFGHTLLILGFALLAPAFVRLCARLVTPLGSRSPLPMGLAVEFFSRSPTRAAATVSAIMVGYALVIVLGSVVHSIQHTLASWITYTFASDLTVGTAPGLNSGTFDTALTMQLVRLPGVASVERYRKSLSLYEGQPVVLGTIDRHNRPDKAPLLVVHSRPAAYEKAEAGDAVFVSESFAFRYGSHLGDHLALDTGVGRRSFEIAAIVRDYTLDLGTILLDINTYQTLWRDTRLTYAHVWKSHSADLGRLRKAVAGVLGDNPQVGVITNSDFRAEVEERVRNLLRVLGSLQILAATIAMLGVVNFLLAAILDRRREIGLLRSIGVTRSQIRQAVIIEAGLIGLAGAGLGVFEGLSAGFLMVTHSMRVTMGWSLDFSFPTALAASTLLAITATAALAGYIPAHRVTTGTVLAGLRTE